MIIALAEKGGATMRLIDADALMEEICEGCAGEIKAECKTDPFCASGMWIAEAPTVDAVPVVHERCKWCNGDYHTKIMATAIRYHTNGNMDGYEMKVNFCPNCGAKMDGDYNE